VDKSLLIKTLLTGVATGALYWALFQNQEVVMHHFTRGGIYAALPVGTAFVFSVVHGAFASNLLSLAGIQAKVTPKRKPKPIAED